MRSPSTSRTGSGPACTAARVAQARRADDGAGLVMDPRTRGLHHLNYLSTAPHTVRTTGKPAMTTKCGLPLTTKLVEMGEEGKEAKDVYLGLYCEPAEALRCRGFGAATDGVGPTLGRARGRPGRLDRCRGRGGARILAVEGVQRRCGVEQVPETCRPVWAYAQTKQPNHIHNRNFITTTTNHNSNHNQLHTAGRAQSVPSRPLSSAFETTSTEGHSRTGDASKNNRRSLNRRTTTVDAGDVQADSGHTQRTAIRKGSLAGPSSTRHG